MIPVKMKKQEYPGNSTSSHGTTVHDRDRAVLHEALAVADFAALPNIELLPHSLPGILITVDGNDGTGKTTLLNGLERRLIAEGREVLRTRQPTTEGRESEAFQEFLFHPDRRDRIDYRALLCLMIGDRLQHLHRVVKPALARGAVVLCDRYIFTQMVTTVTRGFVDEPWMMELYRHVLKPDVGLITHAPFDEVVERIVARSYAREAFYEQEHVRANLAAFREIARLYDLTLLDTSRLSPDEVCLMALERMRLVGSKAAEAR
jgi:dTMP kinase